MNKRIIAYAFISLVIVFSGYITFAFYLCEPKSLNGLCCKETSLFSKYYADNIRGHIFAGFLAMGGFLLSLKTFIVVNIKQSLYDNEEYQKKWRASKKRNPNGSKTLYAPLKELSDLLYFAIAACLFSAIVQMTLGLYENLWAALICIYTCVLASTLLFESLRVIKNNLDSWFEHIDKS